MTQYVERQSITDVPLREQTDAKQTHVISICQINSRSSITPCLASRHSAGEGGGRPMTLIRNEDGQEQLTKFTARKSVEVPLVEEPQSRRIPPQELSTSLITHTAGAAGQPWWGTTTAACGMEPNLGLIRILILSRSVLISLTPTSDGRRSDSVSL
ncbi:hypothetical protein J6590_034542 [Homalodisca vitripennis]|nr:hypothetical protein J6590_034542 [Homalodisca vitripennis]